MSSPKNLFEVQHEVRQNADELQNFMKDLVNWEKDMKRKEEELKLVKMVDEDTIPPIRNSSSKKKNKHKKQKDKEKAAEPERISGSDYSAWEKFDADSELKRLDEDKKESSSSESSDSEEQMHIQQKKQLAIVKKDKGNEFFKQGSYDSAINCYTIGMELDPENPLLPANRAMAFLKKEQFQAAENDCTLCLSLDPTYIKAYLRRGTARRALQKFSLAEEDYLKILEMEPENKLALIDLEKLKKESFKHAKDEEVIVSPKKTYSDMENNKIKDMGETPSSRLENMLNAMEQPQPFLVPSTKTNNSLQQSSQPKLSLPLEPTEVSKPSPQLEDLSEIEGIVKQLEQSLPSIPSAAFQFLNDWRKLSKYPDLKYQYLKQFPPEKLPILFKHDMEAEIFCGILQTLSTSFLEKRDDIFPYMKYLTQVGRFHTLILFLSNKEKKDLKKLEESLKGTDNMSSEVEELLKLYKVR